MSTIFLGCFIFGMLFAVVSGIMGAAHGALDGLGTHADTPQLELSAGAHGHAYHWLGQLNFSALMGFFMWFGGAGWAVLEFTPFGLLGAMLAAVPSGAAAYGLIAWFINKLRSSETVMKPEDYVLDGTVARVTVPASAGGVGEIVFTLAGVRRVEGARAADGRELAKGDEVVITSYERGVAIVENAEAFINGLPETESSPQALEHRPPLALPERETDA